MELYEKVKEEAGKKSMTLAELARRANMSPVTIQYMKKQRVSPTTIRRVADVLKLNDDQVEELVELNLKLPVKRV